MERSVRGRRVEEETTAILLPLDLAASIAKDSKVPVTRVLPIIYVLASKQSKPSKECRLRDAHLKQQSCSSKKMIDRIRADAMRFSKDCWQIIRIEGVIIGVFFFFYSWCVLLRVWQPHLNARIGKFVNAFFPSVFILLLLFCVDRPIVDITICTSYVLILNRGTLVLLSLLLKILILNL